MLDCIFKHTKTDTYTSAYDLLGAMICVQNYRNSVSGRNGADVLGTRNRSLNFFQNSAFFAHSEDNNITYY